MRVTSPEGTSSSSLSPDPPFPPPFTYSGNILNGGKLIDDMAA
eukprot:CAMPEP_0203728694 /NCGR_PEP_ID=MMETSP0092-20131115/14544_1 /ASSEMBLY_ACC=CAM_ASM_001090 /TAXON_ID=426623 /ORGANISM="Chaetoceros affinis, Strain CCMP159" /LENGTH=42 /DNA_ID= /DNA_START= /DNA_END= /DNA_ORIENTATION=